jgi:hypothetical protein
MRRPHRTIGTSHRLDRPAPKDAFESGEIPPIAAPDRSLFTFEASKVERLAPESLDSLLERTQLIVRLLDLGPDAEGSRRGFAPRVRAEGSRRGCRGRRSVAACGGGGPGQVEGRVRRRGGAGR